MGVGNPMGIPFPWESHGNGNSHTAHDWNGNGNKANGNGNSIYFMRVKIPKIIVMHQISRLNCSRQVERIYIIQIHLFIYAP